MLGQTKKFLLLGILVIVLLSSIYTSIVSAATPTETDEKTKTLSILSDVVGLETETYAISKCTQRETYRFGELEKDADMNLVSVNGSLRVTASYIKGNLQLLYFSDLDGQPASKQSVSNTAAMAKGLLNRYQDYAGNSLYGKLSLMLDGMDLPLSLTKIEGDTKLEVTNENGGRTRYSWTYVDKNGVISERKNVILLYEQGQLKAFFNNWPNYDIAETKLNISAEKATSVAIEASKDYSYVVTDKEGKETTVSGFSIAPESLGNAQLIYVNSKEQADARGGDPYTMYLAWIVPIGFDKFYPGDVSGLTVILWADTGEICGINRVIVDSNLVEPNLHDDGSVAFQLIYDESTILPIIGFATAMGGAILFFTRKQTWFASSKKLCLKFFVVLICIAITFSAALTIPAADAYDRSRIYACVDTDFGYRNDPADEAEKNATAVVCNYVGNLSQNEGYVTSNMYGSDTTVANVLNNAHSDEEGYLNSMVFHAGHLSDINTAYQDNTGQPIRAVDLLPQTGPGRHFFTFLWVCVQAEDPTYGTPEAWTHRDGSTGHLHMDSDGFGVTNSDDSGQCYISFFGYSPMLSTYYRDSTHSVFYEYNTLTNDIGPTEKFIRDFYNQTLNYDYSVCDALDIASAHYFGEDYLSSALDDGYNCWWPGGDWSGYQDMAFMVNPGYFPLSYQGNFTQYPNGIRPENRMRVFGDSTIKLQQTQVTLSCVEDNGSHNPPPNAQFTLNGFLESPGTTQLAVKKYTVNIAEPANYDFSHFSYNGQNYGQGAKIPLTAGGNLVAHFTWAPDTRYLTISKTGTGTINPSSGTYPYQGYTYAQVSATPGSGMMHYWSGNIPEGSAWNPIFSLLMDNDRTVQANFVPATTYNFVSHVESSTGAVNDPTRLTGPYTDGNYAVVSSAPPYGVYGEIVTHAYFTTMGHVYVYGYVTSGSGPLDVYTSTDGANWNLLGSPLMPPSAGWVDCGSTFNSFSYIRLKAQQTFCSIFIDSVRVDTATHTLTPATTGSGTIIDPTSPVTCLNDTYRSVTAQAASGWVFDHWEIDDVTQPGNNPYINVLMRASHTVRAVFVQLPPSHVSSVTDYFGAVVYPSNLVGSQIDGQYTLIYGMGGYNVHGWVAGTLNQQNAGHIYIYGYSSGSGTLQVYTSQGGNWVLSCSPTINQGSPGWIDCGTCDTQFSAIKVQTVPASSYCIYIDSIKVQP